MHDTSDADLTRLADWLAGASSPSEARAVEEWIAADAARVRVVEQLRRAQYAVRTEVPARSDRIAARVVQHIAQETPSGTFQRRSVHYSNRDSHHSRASRSWWTTTGIALTGAALVLALSVFLTRTPSPRATTSTRTYVTAPGQWSTITLDHGARAVLGPATTLRVTTRSSAIDAAITGQALFTVIHHDRVSFTVQAENAVARVLGTTFMVQRYPADHRTRIVVTEGRVAVRDVVLATNTLGIVDNTGRVTITPNVAVVDDTAWVNGQLVFHKTPVPDVLAALSRTYGVNITLTDSALAREQLTLTVLATRWTLDDVLSGIMQTLDAHYTVRTTATGRVITITPGRMVSHERRLSFPQEAGYGK